MATVTHTIYSHYDLKDCERLKQETGQLEDKAEAEESWKTELPKYRNQTTVPRFVAATVVCDSWDSSQASSSRQKIEETKVENDIVNWYRSLRRDLTEEGATTQRPPSAPVAPPRPITTSNMQTINTSVREKRDKNNWFIMNVVKSKPPSSSPTSKPPPTLADMLSRDPPPRPNERQYVPPVWLEIGPSNKGFAMLQKKGWNEGEALGPDITRRKRRIEDMGNDLFGGGQASEKSQLPPRVAGKGKGKERMRSPIYVDTNWKRREDVIDLTLSDSDSDSDGGLEAEGVINVPDGGAAVPGVKSEFVEGRLGDQDVCSPSSEPDTAPSSSESPSIGSEDDPACRRRALLTPLATVLKSDRLGIGLKAKTVGPYKASRKRVTHNAAALEAHIRIAEELKKKKKELGHGRRGFERQYRKEALKRQMMLAYMNS